METQFDDAVANGYKFENISLDHTIYVEFALDEKTIMVTVVGCGNVSPSGDIKVVYGGSQDFYITPIEGGELSGIKINGESVEYTMPFAIENITEDLTVEFTFVEFFNVTTISGENGSITESQFVKTGKEVKIQFTPDEGYKVSKIIVNNIELIGKALESAKLMDI